MKRHDRPPYHAVPAASRGGHRKGVPHSAGRPGPGKRHVPHQQQAGRPGVSVRARGARAAAVLAVLGVIFTGWLVTHPASQVGRHNRPGSPVRAVAAPRGLPTPPKSGLMPWHLAVPLSREVAVPGSPGQLIVLGGLTTRGASASWRLRSAHGYGGGPPDRRAPRPAARCRAAVPRRPGPGLRGRIAGHRGHGPGVPLLRAAVAPLPPPLTDRCPRRARMPRRSPSAPPPTS